MFGHLVRMPPLGGLPGTTNWVEAPGQTQIPLQGSYMPSALGPPQDPEEELESVAAEKEVWNTNLSLLPLKPDLG